MIGNIRASDIMTPRVVLATPDMTIAQVAKLMNKYRIGGVPVVKNDKIVGIITERVIMRSVIELDKKPSSVKAKDIMIKKPITGNLSDSIKDLANKMKEKDVSRIPIVNKGKVVGIVTNKDILEHGPGLMDVILEQARIKGPMDPRSGSVAFGKCESCGDAGDLRFRSDSFLCEDCAKSFMKINSREGKF